MDIQTDGNDTLEKAIARNRKRIAAKRKKCARCFSPDCTGCKAGRRI